MNQARQTFSGGFDDLQCAYILHTKKDVRSLNMVVVHTCDSAALPRLVEDYSLILWYVCIAACRPHHPLPVPCVRRIETHFFSCFCFFIRKSTRRGVLSSVYIYCLYCCSVQQHTCGYSSNSIILLFCTNSSINMYDTAVVLTAVVSYSSIPVLLSVLLLLLDISQAPPYRVLVW